MADHSVKVPPGLFTEWLSEALLEHDAKSGTVAAIVADKAAQWAADQELKACCDHMRDHQWGFVKRPDGTNVHRAVYLQESRRPKPPNLKQQALEQFAHVDRILRENGYIPAGCILAALEALPDE